MTEEASLERSKSQKFYSSKLKYFSVKDFLSGRYHSCPSGHSCCFAFRIRGIYEICSGATLHKSIQVTSDIYSHVSKKIDMDSMNRYEEYISTTME